MKCTRNGSNGRWDRGRVRHGVSTRPCAMTPPPLSIPTWPAHGTPCVRWPARAQSSHRPCARPQARSCSVTCRGLVPVCKIASGYLYWRQNWFQIRLETRYPPYQVSHDTPCAGRPATRSGRTSTRPRSISRRRVARLSNLNLKFTGLAHTFPVGPAV